MGNYASYRNDKGNDKRVARSLASRIAENIPLRLPSNRSQVSAETASQGTAEQIEAFVAARIVAVAAFEAKKRVFADSGNSRGCQDDG